MEFGVFKNNAFKKPNWKLFSHTFGLITFDLSAIENRNGNSSQDNEIKKEFIEILL